MKLAISILALAEVAVLLASLVALLVFAVRAIVRRFRRADGDDVSMLGRQAFGVDTVKTWLAQVGLQVSEEDAHEITAAVRAYALEHKTTLSHAEFRDLALSVVKRAAA